MDDIRLQAFDRPEYGDVAFVLTKRDAEGRVIAACRPIEFEATDTPRGATFAMQHRAAQALLECLWAAGLRPKDVGSVGQLQATERHLEDMRRIAFKHLGVG